MVVHRAQGRDDRRPARGVHRPQRVRGRDQGRAQEAMSHRSRVAALPCAAVLIAAGLLAPATASAHRLPQRAALPIPEWLFAWAAAIVLVASFAALAALWPRPRLESPRWRSLGALGAALGSRPVEVLCGAVGLALLGVVLWAGYAGQQGGQENFSP